MESVIGYRYRDNGFRVEGFLRSIQDEERTYPLFLRIYKEVAKELGIELPDAYAYVYPVKRHGDGYITVSAPRDRVIRGNFDYSLYFMIASMPMAVRSIFPKPCKPQEKVRIREEWIREQAVKYFTLLDDESKIELISDCFKVI